MQYDECYFIHEYPCEDLTYSSIQLDVYYGLNNNLGHFFKDFSEELLK